MNGGDGGTPASSPWRRLALAVDNAVELLRTGRLTEPYRTPFDVVHAEPVYKLRRYAPDPAAHGAASGTPLLLVPPLMVTSEVYDISPDLSAVAFLLRHGVDTWLVDFGPPERQQGGMDRTLDDHVRAVSDAVDRVRDALGRDVHLAGYSQGGMFVYQTAALRRSMGLASLVTFGSPVDIHRNVPGVADVVVDRVVGALRDLIERPLEHIDGLPGLLTSWGFRALSFRKELAQLGEFLRHLDDREALARREARRRFIRGEGFVAWPGPALRQFVDEFVVHNRMALGGFVLLGRTVTLADIRCPILCFVGLRDELARPAAVRAIRRAAPAAEVHEVDVPAGHFGLVVGRRAMERTWPTVVEWLGWREARGPIPAPLARPPRERRPEAIDDVVEAAFDDVRLDAALVADVASGALRAVGERLTDAVRRAGRRIDRLRWQLPRLRALASLEPSTRIGFSRALAEAARERPDATFFLWRGRAFRYRDANERVDNVARGLIACGVRPGDRVAVVMDARPSTLSVIGALLRVGAVAVLAGPSMRRLSVDRALRMVDVRRAVVDPENAARVRAAFDGELLVLGGARTPRALPQGAVDMERIDPSRVSWPGWYEPDPGRAADLAMILFASGPDDQPRVARITHGRWAFAALGAAAACPLGPDDTVYCCLPLHHPSGILVATGGALVGGSRLALASGFAPDVFWPEVRRYGATVVFYAGDMARDLVEAPAGHLERGHPVRLFAGSGMRRDVWRRLVERFGVSVLEFYASTEGNAVLANVTGRKVGSLGRPIPGSAPVAVVRWDHDAGRIARDSQGRAIRCGADEPGVLLSRLAAGGPAIGAGADVVGAEARVAHDVFEPGDAWLVGSDLLRIDADGDAWLVDRLSDVVRAPSGPIYTAAIEDALLEHPGILRCAVFGEPMPEGSYERLVAAVVPRPGHLLDAAELDAFAASRLPPHERPARWWVRDQLPMTDGYRVSKRALRDAATRDVGDI